MLSKRLRLVVLYTILILCILFVLVVKFEKQIVDGMISTRGWVQFNIPTNAQQIRASIATEKSGLNICNRDEFNWSDITVKVTGIFNASYLARPKQIQAGGCVYIPYSDFAEPSWKHMQMPPTETVVKAELLVKYEVLGYTSVPLQRK